jgi:hypothetical protein
MGVACCANYSASPSILFNSQTVTMLLCSEQSYLGPKRTIARPSKTQGRATQAIQSSIHPGRANPTVGALRAVRSQIGAVPEGGSPRLPRVVSDSSGGESVGHQDLPLATSLNQPF